MLLERLDIDASAAEPAAGLLFTPLERAVVELARRERGRALTPAGPIGRALARLHRRLTGSEGVRPLADPRLEAIRTFVNALHRHGSARLDAAAARLREVGFNCVQEGWLRSLPPLAA